MASKDINIQLEGQRKVSHNSENSDKDKKPMHTDELDFENDANVMKEPEIREKMQVFQKYMTDKDYASAENEITKIIDLKKGEASFYYLRAEVYMRQNKYLQSLQDMNTAVKYEPVKQCTKSSQYHYEFKKTLMQMSNDI